MDEAVEDEDEREGRDEMDDDSRFLNTIGVTAAKPEDIERHVIAQVELRSRKTRNQGLDEFGEETIIDQVVDSRFVSRKAQILCRLKALDQEIVAVASGLESLQRDNGTEEKLEKADDSQQQALSHPQSETQNLCALDGSILHRALVTDRLKSLTKKRKRIAEQLEALEADELEEREHGRDVLNDTVPAKAVNNSTIETQKLQRQENNVISLLEDGDLDAALDAASGIVETERDRLIRIGVLTPFDRVEGFERRVEKTPTVVKHKLEISKDDSESHAKYSISNTAAAMSALAKSRPSTKLVDASELPKLAPPTREFRRIRKICKTNVPDKEKPLKKQESKERTKRRPMPEMEWRRRHRYHSDDGLSPNEEEEGDDGDGAVEDESGGKGHSYSKTLKRIKQELDDGSDNAVMLTRTGGGSGQDIVLEGGLKIPYSIYYNLFDYQKTGVKWLWELHCQRSGGIIGDEMGLGKTVQVVAFLAALHNSGMYKPSIIVCPVTLLRQWRREVRKWYPAFHVEILHDSLTSSSLKSRKVKAGETESSLDTDEYKGNKELPADGLNRCARTIKDIVQSESGLLVTTYEKLRLLREKLLDVQWGYAVLDEGHRIRNPDTETTLVCKQLQTVHRVIMTGAPIQNKLTELWSLFDFVFPGKLGVLPVFQAQFALPISIGGYANATPLQVSTAYKCAVVLRDLIMPYLLRRMKSDVDAQLPKKTEHVLFCSLTEEQRSAYRAFLASSEVEQIFEGNRNSLYGIDILRKICNHPDLLEREHSGNHPDYGNPQRSGKLKVVAEVLDLWKSQGHRVLLFSQTQQMLDIIENYFMAKGFVYRRMDGSTPIKQRMAMIDEFNEATHVFTFIMTTKVGGIGTNLIGANRVIIYDPDWNPSTDMQARERAWRIGQTRDVTIYRLITRGTIEEKVYHRQIYKHFLTNKILRDPQQRRFFKARDMRDLFILQDDKPEDKTETSAIFAELAGEIDLADEKRKAKHDKKSRKTSAPIAESSGLCNAIMDIQNKAKIANEDWQEKALGRGKENVAADEEIQEDECQILKNLFEANGIHSAFNHDAIESMNDTEKKNVDNESARVAQRAAEAVRESRMLRGSDNVSVPTWTGRSGTAGAPMAIKRRFGSTVNSHLAFSSSIQSSTRTGMESGVGARTSGGWAGSSMGKALTSSDILTRIRESQINAAGAGMDGVKFSANRIGSSDSRSGGGRRSKLSVQPEILIQQVCSFMKLNGGSVSSAHIVEQFKDVVPAQDVPAFRQLLMEIAIFRKEGSEARWVLKDEYLSGQD